MFIYWLIYIFDQLLALQMIVLNIAEKKILGLPVLIILNQLSLFVILKIHFLIQILIRKIENCLLRRMVKIFIIYNNNPFNIY